MLSEIHCAYDEASTQPSLKFTVKQALNCPQGGFPSIQIVTSLSISARCAMVLGLTNREGGTWVAINFGGGIRNIHFVTYLFIKDPATTVLGRHKRRAYDQQVREVQHSTYSLLVFSTWRSIAPATAVQRMVVSTVSTTITHTYEWEIYCKTGNIGAPLNLAILALKI